ncbi:hypothetical protein Aci022_161 [Acinetobacter phage vB_AbaM_B09_Aci02-2]|uniref:Uncharacterized protein n=1 Tax=Acinetobacter phage vB_AbaM_B09_Aci02-2 TaxID=2315467 RepID=A0A386KK12_9CAUD|nr:hypothetical protein HOU30_gp029 [Acinetobacter phage vB_AbaM_B09_Aci02-2]AYD85752.1 hypothetical protein Aci022_161 [Acinetobacter phage vB_AbaM_B09_Aci02-2]
MELIRNVTVAKLSLGTVESEYQANDLLGQLVYSKFEEFRDNFISCEITDCYLGNDFVLVGQEDVIKSNLEEIHFQCNVLYDYVFDVVCHAGSLSDEDDEQGDYLYESLKKGTFAQDLHNLDYSDLDGIKMGLKQSKIWMDNLIKLIEELKK